MIALVIMMLALQYDQYWLVLAIVAIMIITMRSVGTTVLLIVALGTLYFLKGNMEPYWPFVFFGLIILALALGVGGKPEQPEYYSPDMYSGLMGGGMA
jgi:hypothetical protein